ncbi:MAG TPA: hypothetical protein PK263_04780, partial [bacterium]|nr:hypothetical protein [bacterium]
MNSIEKIARTTFIRHFCEFFPAGRIFVVGGAVRDLLLGIESTDFDLVVEGVGVDELFMFLEKEGKVVDVEGRNFGVFKFNTRKIHEKENTKNHENLIFDIAVTRKEQYVPGARRKDAEVKLEEVSIEEDLARRDFTINSMAIELMTKTKVPKQKESPKSNLQNQDFLDFRFHSLLALGSGLWVLIDPYHGKKDLKDRLIRAVG